MVVLGKLLRGSSVTGSSTPGGSTPAAESALFDSFEFMGEHYNDRWLFLSRPALNWVPRLYYTGHRGSQDSTNASGGDIADIWTQNAKLATLSTCNDITLGLIAVLGVIGPGSGYVVALGKLLRGGLGTRVERSTVRKVDQNGRNGQTRDSNTRRPWPRRTMFGWLWPTNTTLTTSVPSMEPIQGDLLR